MSDYDTGVIVAASVSGAVCCLVSLLYARWLLDRQGPSSVDAASTDVSVTNKTGDKYQPEHTPPPPPTPPSAVVVDVDEPPSSPPPPLLDTTVEVDRFHPSRTTSKTDE